MASTSELRRRARLGVGAVCISLVLVLATLGWQLVDSTVSRRELVLQGNQASARIAGALVSTELRSHLRAVEGMARRPDFVQLVAAGDWAMAGIYLEALLGLDPELGSAAVLDAEGAVWARHPEDPSVIGRNFAARDYFQGAIASEGGYVSEIFRQAGAPQAVVVAFAASVRESSGKVVGVVLVTLPVETLLLLSKESKVPNGGSVQLFDQAGHSTRVSSNKTPRSYVSHPLVRNALAGLSGVEESRLPGLDGIRLVAYEQVPGFGWAVMVEQSKSEAFRPIAALRGRLAAAAALVLLVGLISALIVVRLIRKLDAERIRRAAVLASIAEGVVTTDPNGNITSINPAMEDLGAWEQAQVIGLPYSDVYSFYDDRGRELPLEKRVLGQAIETGERVASHGFDLMLQARDGRRVPVAITAAPILDGDGELVGGVDIIRDVSSDREVDQMKSALISTVSHELRTPLTMIQGFSELLLAGGIGPEKSAEALRQINSSAERLGRLIDDLLSVSRIESGRLAPRSSELDLSSLIAEVTAPFAEVRTIETDIPRGLPGVIADRDMLVQVLTNLVSNAAKYSPESEPIEIAAIANGRSAEISITDRGIGMTEQEMSNLFEKFYRVDRPEVHKAGGTGLGLFITRSLVEMQGGQIWVSSSSGGGSTFSFSLPVAARALKEKVG